MEIPSNTIPIVALGVYRDVAAKTDPLFTNTPFRMTAILDLKQDPPAVRYSPQNLLAVLFNLHPRPKVFITGAAIPPDMAAESIAVWESYVSEAKAADIFVIDVSADDDVGYSVGYVWLLISVGSCAMGCRLGGPG